MSVSIEEFNALKDKIDALQRGQSTGERIAVGSYLLTRLAQLGVTTMFGVPGDFNLGFLDLVEDHPTIEWAGNCNELNAAYAADGYARVNEGSLGIVLTTFGVGELSAMNGIAGSFSEMVPVLHVVGVPSTAQQKSKPMLHHTLGDGRYDAYEKAAEQVTISQASLFHLDQAASEIDRVLSDCITKARPTYLMLPTDIAYAKIPSDRLKTPISRLPLPNDPETEHFVISEITSIMQAAGDKAVILVDACAIRHDVRTELADFVKKTGLAVFSAPMGKTAVDADYPNFGGIYVGSISHPEIREEVENAPLIFSIGSVKSDFNTGNFTYRIPTEKTIELHSDHTKIKYAVYPGIGMKDMFPKLISKIPQACTRDIPSRHLEHVPQEDSDIISHAWMWPRVGKFFRSNDVIVAETGTSSYGILDVPFPKGARFISQILYGSIGYSLGSLLGASYAARDLKLGRPILFIGDGSMQLTVQELATMIRVGLKPIIFVLNNNGYTIERYLHGWERKYNNITPWKWTGLLNVLGDADGTRSKSYTVKTKAEFSKLLDDESFAKADKIQLVEIIMDQFDAPVALKNQAELSQKANKYVS